MSVLRLAISGGDSGFLSIPEQVWMSHFQHPTVFQACNNTSDRKHADSILEKYVTEIVMSIVTTFFSSPFSDQSTTLQVRSASVVGLSCMHLQSRPSCGVAAINEPLCKVRMEGRFVRDAWVQKYG